MPDSSRDGGVRCGRRQNRRGAHHRGPCGQTRPRRGKDGFRHHANALLSGDRRTWRGRRHIIGVTPSCPSTRRSRRCTRFCTSDRRG
jgi:hypothetical protein